MARREKKPEESAGSPAWMTTFSDLMSLLLTFFILLYSMSSVSEEKFAAASQSIQSALLDHSGNSLLEGTESMDEVEVTDESSSKDALPEEVQEMYEKAQEFVAENELGTTVSLSRDERGMYVDIQDSILFDSGRADVNPAGKETLALMAEFLNMFDNRIVIEGYTDNVPSRSSDYPTNWELSTDRAVSVLRYFAEEEGIEPGRLSAVGYGEYQPTVPNDSASNRAKNRRVNIVLVHEPKGVDENESNG